MPLYVSKDGFDASDVYDYSISWKKPIVQSWLEENCTSEQINSKIYYKEDKYGNKEKYRIPVRNKCESSECTSRVALPTHTLVLSQYKYRLASDWICNKCSKQFPTGTERWFCQLCNNDICIECFN